MTHSIESNSHKIIGDSSGSTEERSRPSVSETMDLVAEDVFAELKKGIDALSEFDPPPGTENMHSVVLETSRKELAEAEDIFKSIKEVTGFDNSTTNL